MEKTCSTAAGGQNVGEPERIASGIAGVLLLTAGLARGRKSGWLLALLGSGLIYRGVTGTCKAYDVLGVNTTSLPHGPRISVPGNRGIRVEKSIFVRRPPADLFQTWRNFENLPHFMTHLASVHMLDNKRSHWVAKGPAGQVVQWDAEVINEHPGEMIAWRSLEGADVDHAGTVRFRPVEGGTEVRVLLEYDPPGGAVGATIARLFGSEPAQRIEEDMRRFKHLMEVAG
jgi:uncharacterized membrane protein